MGLKEFPRALPDAKFPSQVNPAMLIAGWECTGLEVSTTESKEFSHNNLKGYKQPAKKPVIVNEKELLRNKKGFHPLHHTSAPLQARVWVLKRGGLAWQ